MSDPDAVAAAHWQSMTHAQLYEAVHTNPSTGTADRAAEMWEQLRANLDDHDRRMTQAVKMSQGDWAGVASDAMADVQQALSAWVKGAVGDAQTMAASIKEQGVQAQFLLNTMPPPAAPVAAAPAGDSAYADAVGQQVALTQQQATNDADRARELMRAYADRSAVTRTQLGVWSVPPTATVTVSDPQAASGPAVTAHSTAGPAVAHTSTAAAAPTGVAAPGVAHGSIAAAPHVEAAGAGALPVAGGVGGAAPTRVVPGPGSKAATLPQAEPSALPGAAQVGPGSGSRAATLPQAGPSALPGALRTGATDAGVRAPGGRRQVDDPGALAPGAGGRGMRPGPSAPSGGGSARPSWREDVARNGSGVGESVGGPARPTAPQREVLPGNPTEPVPARAGAGGTSTMMPPVGAGGRREERTHRRPDYLVEQSFFDVRPECVDGVIGGEEETGGRVP